MYPCVGVLDVVVLGDRVLAYPKWLSVAELGAVVVVIRVSYVVVLGERKHGGGPGPMVLATSKLPAHATAKVVRQGTNEMGERAPGDCGGGLPVEFMGAGRGEGEANTELL